MAAALSASRYFVPSEDIQGAPVAKAKLDITGLAIGANTVAHGLPTVPRTVTVEKSASGLTVNIISYDATNVTVQSSAAGTCTLAVEYGV